MAANLDFKLDGTSAFAWSKEALHTPWHGEGTPVESHMTVTEALAASGAGFKVEKCVMSIEGTPVPDYVGLRRADTKEVLGVAKKGYSVIQNEEAARAIEDLIDGGVIRFETMGVLLGGVFFAAAKILEVPEDVTVADETMERHIMIVNAHDGSKSCTFKPVVTLPVCSNTVRLALDEKSERIARVRHSGDTSAKLALLPEALGVVDNRVRRFAEAGNALAMHKISDADFRRFAEALIFPDRPTLSTRARNILRTIEEIFHNGPGQELDGRKGTAWGAFNAITAFNAHFSSLRETTQRTTHVVLGRGNQLNERAMKMLAEMTGT